MPVDPGTRGVTGRSLQTAAFEHSDGGYGGLPAMCKGVAGRAQKHLLERGFCPLLPNKRSFQQSTNNTETTICTFSMA